MIILLIILLNTTQALKFCSPDKLFCVTTTRNLCITVKSQATGWNAVGLGTSMKDSEIYVAWVNLTTQIITLAKMKGIGHVQPTLAPIQDVTLMPPEQDSSFKTTFTFCPQQMTTTKSGKETKFIYAYSHRAPSTPNSFSTKFAFHENFNTFTLDLTKADTNTSVSTTFSSSAIANFPLGTPYPTILKIYGAMVWIGWMTASLFCV